MPNIIKIFLKLGVVWLSTGNQFIHAAEIRPDQGRTLKDYNRYLDNKSQVRDQREAAKDHFFAHKEKLEKRRLAGVEAYKQKKIRAMQESVTLEDQQNPFYARYVRGKAETREKYEKARASFAKEKASAAELAKQRMLHGGLTPEIELDLVDEPERVDPKKRVFFAKGGTSGSSGSKSSSGGSDTYAPPPPQNNPPENFEPDIPPPAPNDFGNDEMAPPPPVFDEPEF